MIKKVLLLIGILLVFLIAILLVNTLTFHSRQIEYPSVVRQALEDSAIMHMRNAVKIPTISNEEPTNFNEGPFLAFRRFLASTYPLCDSLLHPEVVNNYSLLYT